ncbi:MAG: TrbC/VirB2 family protein [Pseudomonadota bacterium]
MTPDLCQRPRLSAAFRRALVLALLFAAPMASAQDLSPVQAMFETIEAALTGPIGISLATLAIIVTGFLCFMGRLNWVWFASIVVGIVLVFSADDIVAGFA